MNYLGYKFNGKLTDVTFSREGGGWSEEEKLSHIADLCLILSCTPSDLEVVESTKGLYNKAEIVVPPTPEPESAPTLQDKLAYLEAEIEALKATKQDKLV